MLRATHHAGVTVCNRDRCAHRESGLPKCFPLRGDPRSNFHRLILLCHSNPEDPPVWIPVSPLAPGTTGWNCSPIPPLVVKTIGTKSIPRCRHRSLFASRVAAPTPPARPVSDTSAHRAAYNGVNRTPLHPPPAHPARSRTATSLASVPDCHVPIDPGPPHRRYLAANPKTQHAGGSGAYAGVPRDAVEARAWETRNSTGASGTLPRRHEESANSETGALPRSDGLRGQTVQGKHRGLGRSAP